MISSPVSKMLSSESGLAGLAGLDTPSSDPKLFSRSDFLALPSTYDLRHLCFLVFFMSSSVVVDVCGKSLSNSGMLSE